MFLETVHISYNILLYCHSVQDLLSLLFTTIHHLGLSRIPTSSRIEQKNKGDKIEGVLRKEFPRLADEIDPETVARYLYGLSIIDRSELELAMVKSVKQTDRSSRLLLHLIRKLKANPTWCHEAIVALKKAGVNTESITVALKDAGISK